MSVAIFQSIKYTRSFVYYAVRSGILSEVPVFFMSVMCVIIALVIVYPRVKTRVILIFNAYAAN